MADFYKYALLVELLSRLGKLYIVTKSDTTHIMYTSQNVTNADVPPAEVLGRALRQARQKQGLTMAQLAEEIGRPREWLNRVELGYSQYGEHRPPSEADLKSLYNILRDHLGTPLPDLLEMREQAQTIFDSFKRNPRRRRQPNGKLTQAEVIIGEGAIIEAIEGLINEQHSDAVIRNTGVKWLDSYVSVTKERNQYRAALRDFLAKNPRSLFKRVEYVASPELLQVSKAAEVALAGGWPLSKFHNAKIKFHKYNPIQLHLLIGQREAIMMLPQTSGQPASSIALLVRDKVFVEALRVWFDEVLWEGVGPSQMVNFAKFDESFEEIKQMYGFKD